MEGGEVVAKRKGFRIKKSPEFVHIHIRTSELLEDIADVCENPPRELGLTGEVATGRAIVSQLGTIAEQLCELKEELARLVKAVQR